MLASQKRRFSALFVVIGLFVGLVAAIGTSRIAEIPAVAAVSAKHTICHRTSATTNPYRRITVSINAVYTGNSGNFKSAKHPIHNDYPFKANASGISDSDSDGFIHDQIAPADLSAAADADGDGTPNSADSDYYGVGTIVKDGSGNITSIRVKEVDNIYRAGWTYPSNQKKWGDIIPPYQSNWDELNYGTDGQAIFSGAVAGCTRLTTLQYIQGESASGRTLSEIASDLDEQGASEDLALRESLGGSFVTWVANNPGATIQSFETAVTAANPSADTLEAADVLTASAQLRGSGFPKGVASTYYFQYATCAAGLDSSTTRRATGVSSISTSSVPVSLSVTGLATTTEYCYRLIGVSSITDPDSANDTVESVAEGDIVRFTTGAVSVATLPESNVGNTSATLNGSASPNTTATDLFFQYGTSLPLPTPSVGHVSLVNVGMNVSGSQGSSSNSASSVPVDMAVTGLSQATTYYFRIVGQHSGSTFVIGEVEQFTTTGGPTVATGTASGVTSSAAVLEGTVTPNSINVDIFFQWSTSFAGVSSATESNTGMSVSGSQGTSSNSATQVPVTLPISGLSASTTYYFRIVARNASNNALVYQGNIATFTTPAAPSPSVVTAPTTTEVKRQGPPAKTNNSGGGNGGPPATDPRTGDSDPIENKVIVQVGPTLPGGGGGGGSLRIAPPPNEPGLELLDATIDDPDYEIEVVRSGTDYNKPQTWEEDGFGDECWKTEPPGSSYVLPDPPAPPSGRTGGSYSAVKVKAGSLTSDDPNFQVNTLFLDPAPGSMVWPDSNKDGLYNPGGRNGDKDISHVIFCVKYGAPPSSPTTTAAPGASTTTAAPGVTTTAAPGVTTTAAPGASTTTAAPGASTTTAAPGVTTTAAPGVTTTAAPGVTTTAAPAPPAAPTTTIVPDDPEIEISVRRVQSLPEDSTTTTADGPRSRRIELVVTNGFKQSKLEIEVDLSRFIMTGGNVPLPQLPKTGSTSNQPIKLALVTVALGAMLVLARRRLRNI